MVLLVAKGRGVAGLVPSFEVGRVQRFQKGSCRIGSHLAEAADCFFPNCLLAAREQVHQPPRFGGALGSNSLH